MKSNDCKLSIQAQAKWSTTSPTTKNLSISDQKSTWLKTHKMNYLSMLKIAACKLVKLRHRNLMRLAKWTYSKWIRTRLWWRTVMTSSCASRHHHSLMSTLTCQNQWRNGKKIRKENHSRCQLWNLDTHHLRRVVLSGTSIDRHAVVKNKSRQISLVQCFSLGLIVITCIKLLTKTLS